MRDNGYFQESVIVIWVNRSGRQMRKHLVDSIRPHSKSGRNCQTKHKCAIGQACIIRRGLITRSAQATLSKHASILMTDWRWICPTVCGPFVGATRFFLTFISNGSMELSQTSNLLAVYFVISAHQGIHQYENVCLVNHVVFTVSSVKTNVSAISETRLIV